MEKKSLLFCVLVALCCVHVYECAAVRRNVKDYGAVGDGRNDDTKAIIKALTEGRGDNPNAPYGSTTYSSSTKTPAYVYFPAGTYLVTETLPIVYYTQMIGDPANLPTIKFVNNNEVRVLEVAGGWYTGANQDNFYRQIRNFVIDMTSCNRCTGIHWQVAQATSITNVHFKANKGSDAQGMWMENGSGGFISDLTFEGGKYGMWVGNQQFTSRNITIRDVSAAGIYLNWDWVWTFINLQVTNAPVAIELAQGIGSTVVIDSHFTNVPIGIKTVFSQSSGVDSVYLENLQFDTNGAAIVVSDSGNAVLKVSSSTNIKAWAQGYMWKDGKNTLGTFDLSSVTPKRPSVLTSNGADYVGKQRPLFVGETIVDVTTLGLVGDGNTDNTAKLQQALNNYANKAVLFFPHGIYILSNTVVVPPGSKLLGEVWSVLAADGNAFKDASKPTPMLQVGTPGQQGVAQLVDLLFSTRGPQPGAKLIEWNIRDPNNQQAAAGLWDVHFRIGGAVGTNIGPNNCPKGDGSSAPASSCNGVWALIHITNASSAYLENVWGWTADHDIDQGPQINVYTTRGLLCESQGPVWLYGTAMEHNVLYQYNFNHANNVFMGAIQTETPYYQPSTRTPALTRTHPTDPTFCNNDASCQMSWGLVINNSTNVNLYSAGLYSFFSVWGQQCLQGAQPNCQMNMVQILNSKQIHIYALSTYGSVYMLSSNEAYSKAADNKNTFCATAIVNQNLW